MRGYQRGIWRREIKAGRSVTGSGKAGSGGCAVPARRRIRFRIPAAASARVVPKIPPSKDRGRRESRVRAAPAVSCAMCTKKCAHEHTGSAESIRPSLRNGFTAYSALSPVNGLSCHRRHADRSAQLDASVGASGPHDFAVRVSVARLASQPASTASRTNVRDDRDTPLLRVRDVRIDKAVSTKPRSEIFFQRELDLAISKQPDGQITWVKEDWTNPPYPLTPAVRPLP